eukprot:symbB.v1.2.019357.t1/scaffold1564.1/size111405/8
MLGEKTKGQMSAFFFHSELRTDAKIMEHLSKFIPTSWTFGFLSLFFRVCSLSAHEVSVAKRVSQEMGDPLEGPGSRDSLVGYQIRLEKKVASSTRLLFCTVGVLLKQMQQGLGALSKVTHIFIDEIHERSADCDLLLLLLRQIRTTRPDLRLVLMSATMETDKLVRYFGSPATVPVLSIPGRTFPVQQFWLEDVIQMTGYRCEEDSEFAKKGWNRGWKTEKKSFQVADKGKTKNITEFIDDEDEWGCCLRD